MLNTESRNRRQGLTLIEVLVVIAIIGILAALLFPVLCRPRSNAQRTACINNVRQIDFATRMYCDDHNDAVVLPTGFVFYSGASDWGYYKNIVKSYLSLAGTNSLSEKIFVCPADTFMYLDADLSGGPAWKGFREGNGLCQESWTGYSSYAFNGGNRIDPKQFPLLANPGIAGMSLTAVKNPARTLLVLEGAARLPFSWHRPEVGGGGYYRFDDSMNVLGFVDGHVNFSKMYWNGAQAACMYDPPEQYGYKWSGD